MNSYAAGRSVVLFVSVVASMATGCAGAADGSGASGTEADEGTVGTTTQALLGSWSPSSLSSLNVKISRNPTASPYEWDNAGNPGASGGRVCFGSAGSNNVNSVYCAVFSIPFPHVNSDIKAVAIAQNTSHVFTWYVDGTVSEGTSNDLAHYSSPHAFTHNTFGMSALIDADVAPNGAVYYYWHTGSTYWRTIGDSTHAENSSLATSILTTGQVLQAISFQSSGKIEAWYANGQWDLSTDSLNLAQ